MKLLVCGGRVGIEVSHVYAVLEYVSRRGLPGVPMWPSEALNIIHGGAPLVDQAADDWAKGRGVPVVECRVDPMLDGYRDNAPKRRNARMYDTYLPEACLGFPGGPGTRHMMQYALDHGSLVFDVELDGDHASIHRWGPISR